MIDDRVVDIKEYVGKEVLCKKDFILPFWRKDIIIIKSGKFYKIELNKNKYKPLYIRNMYFSIDEFYKYFELKTKAEKRLEKIEKLWKDIEK